MSDKLFRITNKATQMGFQMTDSSFVPNIILQQRSKSLTLVLFYNRAEAGVDYEKAVFHVSGEGLSYKNKSGASGEIDGGIEFVTILEGTVREHEAIRAGGTLFRKRSANGHWVSEQQANEVIFECPYDFAIFMAHLKKCEYNGGRVHRCYPFGYSLVEHFNKTRSR